MRKNWAFTGLSSAIRTLMSWVGTERLEPSVACAVAIALVIGRWPPGFMAAGSCVGQRGSQLWGRGGAPAPRCGQHRAPGAQQREPGGDRQRGAEPRVEARRAAQVAVRGEHRRGDRNAERAAEAL